MFTGLYVILNSSILSYFIFVLRRDIENLKRRLINIRGKIPLITITKNKILISYYYLFLNHLVI